MEFKKGQLLISEPFVGDENFERTVILICENNDQGTVGFILNKPTNLILEDVMEDMEGMKLPLFVGGPVEQNSLHFIYRNQLAGLEETNCIQGSLYWGGDFDQLRDMLDDGRAKENDIRFFVGYSGWSPEQLKDEFTNKSWFIGELSADEIFDTDPDDLWRSVLRKKGGKYKMYSNYPIDPRLN